MISSSRPSPNSLAKIVDRQVPKLVDHLFRHKAGQMISALTRYFGMQNLELVQDIVQESLVRALQQWPYRGIPENPGGWLWQTAKNQALDVLRREARFQKRLQGEIGLVEMDQVMAGSEASAYPFEADQLSMMFMGCHPALSREVQIALVLSTVSGFSAAEIARAFLIPEATLAQRLVRAKAKLRTLGVQFELPAEAELAERRDVVLDVLYLLFNEGYNAHLGETLVQEDICMEAIYLCRLMANHAAGRFPRVQALLALMLLQGSRLKARTDSEGDLVLLRDQNRSAWDKEMIREGIYYLGLSAEGNVLSRYHLEAGIAAKHAVAESYQQTDWVGILNDYETLLEIEPSPVVHLNHAVAFAMVHGTEAGLKKLMELKDKASLHTYYLLPATFGELYERSGKFELAEQSYREALALTANETEQRFLQKKLHEIKMK